GMTTSYVQPSWFRQASRRSKVLVTICKKDRTADGRMKIQKLHGSARPLPQRLRRLVRPAWLGTLRRTRPLSNDFGYDRGTPVDRYYIERFLARHQSDVKGRVLEVK